MVKVTSVGFRINCIWSENTLFLKFSWGCSSGQQRLLFLQTLMKYCGDGLLGIHQLYTLLRLIQVMFFKMEFTNAVIFHVFCEIFPVEKLQPSLLQF